MKQIIARGRQMGKSTISDIQNIIIQQQALQMQKSIDKMLIDEIGSLDKYRLVKSWRNRRGQQMHRIAANDEVWDWLTTEHDQYGVSNPEWWKFQHQINITDKLYTLMVLKFAE
jgi:hypothetical protein